MQNFRNHHRFAARSVGMAAVVAMTLAACGGGAPTVQDAAGLDPVTTPPSASAIDTALDDVAPATDAPTTSTSTTVTTTSSTTTMAPTTTQPPLEAADFSVPLQQIYRPGGEVEPNTAPTTPGTAPATVPGTTSPAPSAPAATTAPATGEGTAPPAGSPAQGIAVVDLASALEYEEQRVEGSFDDWRTTTVIANEGLEEALSVTGTVTTEFLRKLWRGGSDDSFALEVEQTLLVAPLDTDTEGVFRALTSIYEEVLEANGFGPLNSSQRSTTLENGDTFYRWEGHSDDYDYSYSVEGTLARTIQGDQISVLGTDVMAFSIDYRRPSELTAGSWALFSDRGERMIVDCLDLLAPQGGALQVHSAYYEQSVNVFSGEFEYSADVETYRIVDPADVDAELEAVTDALLTVFPARGDGPNVTDERKIWRYEIEEPYTLAGFVVSKYFDDTEVRAQVQIHSDSTSEAAHNGEG